MFKILCGKMHIFVAMLKYIFYIKPMICYLNIILKSAFMVKNMGFGIRKTGYESNLCQSLLFCLEQLCLQVYKKRKTLLLMWIVEKLSDIFYINHSDMQLTITNMNNTFWGKNQLLSLVISG